jgi:hypothetical protein
MSRRHWHRVSVPVDLSTMQVTLASSAGSSASMCTPRPRIARERRHPGSCTALNAHAEHIYMVAHHDCAAHCTERPPPPRRPPSPGHGHPGPRPVPVPDLSGDVGAARERPRPRPSPRARPRFCQNRDAPPAPGVPAPDSDLPGTGTRTLPPSRFPSGGPRPGPAAAGGRRPS